MPAVLEDPEKWLGPMFITLEDETGIANLIIWPSLFEKKRRTILGAQMMGYRGNPRTMSLDRRL